MAGNAPNITDGNLSFPPLNGGVDPNPNGTSTNPADDFQTLIMPEPTFFLNAALGRVSIIRPTAEPNGGARAAVQSFFDDGLFINNNSGIVAKLFQLADEADAARRLG